MDLASIAAELKSTPSSRSASPAEIGRVLADVSRQQGIASVTAAIGLKDVGTVKQFIRVLDLPADLQSKVAWKRSSGTLPFTVACEIARLPSADDARDLWGRAVAQKMTKRDVREAIGLYACRAS